MPPLSSFYKLWGLVMKRQKRVALVNDITGFGRCSMTVELPIVSALKVEACPLPTALLSVHTAFPFPYIQDQTHIMEPYIENWRKHQVTFDGISTGFLGSKEQVAIVKKFIQDFSTDETVVIVDPVMGDWGKLYASYTKELSEEMKHLVPLADVITPNLTEASYLLDIPYLSEEEITMERLEKIAQALADKGPKQVIITGISREEKIGNFVYEKGEASSFIGTKKIGGERSGTGDVFTGIITGSIVRGDSLTTSVRKAIDFIGKALAYTETLNLPPAQGIAFEEFLTEL